MVRELDAGWGFVLTVFAIALTIIICTVSYNSAPHVEQVCLKGHDAVVTTGIGTSYGSEKTMVCDLWQEQIVK